MGLRWFAALAAVCALGGLGGSGCGDDKPPLFDRSSFSGMHENEIRKDCAETLQCFAQMSIELPDDPMNRCLEDSATVLESSEDKRNSFLAKYARCSAFVVCDYYNCTKMGTDGYGVTQLPKVMHFCQAEIDCRMANQMFSGDRATAMQGCIASKTGALDLYATDRRAAYERSFTQCMNLTGCQFTACFNDGMALPAAPPTTTPTMP